MSIIKQKARNIKYGTEIQSALTAEEHLMFQNIMSCSARDSVICICGTELPKDARFCNVCGKRMEDIINSQEANKAVEMKECICGAKVPVG